jgi:hypothetical protein
LNNQPTNDLRLMFLEQIAIETPEATVRLFELRDAGEWQEEYRVSAEWLDSFLRAVIENGQTHMDYVTRLGYPDLRTSSAAAAWLRTVTLYGAGHEIGRAIEKAKHPRITYLNPAEDKRRPSRQCCWLVSWLFARMSDERIQVASGVKSWEMVCKTRGKFAVTIGLRLNSQKGRRGHKVCV